MKTHHDVLGWQINCLWYKKCPLCYGCRNYDSKYLRCQKCAENKKKNICNRELHTENILNRMIAREEIVVHDKRKND